MRPLYVAGHLVSVGLPPHNWPWPQQPGGLVWFALQAQILLAQLKGDQEREEEVRERLQVAPG
jgi:hypothetical protein